MESEYKFDRDFRNLIEILEKIEKKLCLFEE